MEPVCPLCSSELKVWRCEYICPNHGVVGDCGDPMVEQYNAGNR